MTKNDCYDIPIQRVERLLGHSAVLLHKFDKYGRLVFWAPMKNGRPHECT